MKSFICELKKYKAKARQKLCAIKDCKFDLKNIEFAIC